MNVGHRQGRLTRDPECRYLKGGSTVTRFGVAMNHRRKNTAGEWEDGVPTFLDCEAWAGTGLAIVDIFKKGDPIIIHESIKTDEWTDKEGNTKTKLVFVVRDFERVDNYDYKAHCWRGSAKSVASTGPSDPEGETVLDDGELVTTDVPF